MTPEEEAKARWLAGRTGAVSATPESTPTMTPEEEAKARWLAKSAGVSAYEQACERRRAQALAEQAALNDMGLVEPTSFAAAEAMLEEEQTE